eukprot:354288-Chlamydomonas_euryale.AAC.1
MFFTTPYLCTYPRTAYGWPLNVHSSTSSSPQAFAKSTTPYQSLPSLGLIFEVKCTSMSSCPARCARASTLRKKLPNNERCRWCQRRAVRAARRLPLALNYNN